MRSNRRKFIKRASGLVVPAAFGIFVPKLIRAAAIVTGPGARGHVAAGGISYDFRESFEGSQSVAGTTGTCLNTGWSADNGTGGTMNMDYTATVLKGAESLILTHTAQTFLYRTIALTGGFVSVSALFRVLTEVTFVDILLMNVTNYYDNTNLRIRIGGAGTLRGQISGVQIDSDVSYSTATTYRLWIDYTTDTQFDFSLSGAGDETKPGSPQVSATAAEVPAADLTKLTLLQGANGSVIWDDIIVHSSAIGSNP